MKKILVLTILAQILLTSKVSTQTHLSEYEWVDSVYQSLNTDQKIGQLFMIRSFSKNDALEIKKVTDYVENFFVGGICFFQGTPDKMGELINYYQNKSKFPLMIGIDCEWGLAMRFPESTINFPKQLTLGAISDNQLIEDMAKEIALQCKHYGIHINFAPVVDVNNNPMNPVINNRSFGEEKYNVSAKALAYMRGLQQNGVMACAKHFPGHGDTETDSHHDLPIINHNLDRLHDLELFPFKALINEGVSSVMVGHLHLPILDDRNNRSTTLSYRTVTDLLKNELQFNGLIFTDAMEMKGVSKHFSKGEADVEALLAGNHMILLPEDLPSSIAAIKKHLSNGTLQPSVIENAVKKILQAKYQYKIYERKLVNNFEAKSFVNRAEAIALKEKLLESSITLVEDTYSQIPIKNKTFKTYQSIVIGGPLNNSFQRRLDSYGDFNHIALNKDISTFTQDQIVNTACDFDYVIVSIHDMLRSNEKNFGINTSTLKFIEELNNHTNLILCVFGSPYALKFFDKVPTILMSYEDDDLVQDITAQAIFGAINIGGKLPVSASQKFKREKGLVRNTNGILGFAVPERVNVSSAKLNQIDNIAFELIKAKAAPGCQILIAKDNKVIYQKSFGFHTYERINDVEQSDVYDLASLTKVLSSTLCMMKLYDQKKIDLNGSLLQYLPDVYGSNKADIKVGDMLAHQARLQASISFYENTMVTTNKARKLSDKYYRNKWEENFSIPVSRNLFLKNNYLDSIWKKIYDTPLLTKKEYKYSDIGFYFVKKIVENNTGQSLDYYATHQFYKPLGLYHTGYHPMDHTDLDHIAPTEIDKYWRNQTVHGTVHDMGAAMLGGVGGHAGLFSNSFEIATIMQMLLNGGQYGGVRFLSKNTIQKFTQRYNGSTRRGLGFDMQETNKLKLPNLSLGASNSTYGHTGFTGTCAYADPDNNLIYVFLSNRTYPTMNHNLLNKNNYRTRIQDLIYQAIK